MGGVGAQLAAQDGPPPPSDPEDYHPGRILIQPKAGVTSVVLDQFHQNQGSRVLQTYAHIDGIQVVGLANHANVPEMVAQYRHSGLVEFAEPDHRLRLATEPNDPRYLDGSLWHLRNTGQNGGVAGADIDAPEGWDTMRHAEEVIVAIVDTGIRYTHEDLAANMWVNPGEIADGTDTDGNGYIDDIHGINAVGNNGNPIDLIGHGTQVAGLIGAVGNNAKGVTGVAWSVRLMALRFYDDSGNGYVSDAVKCIDYARKHGAHIINASFISSSYSSTLYSAINRCGAAGIIFVAAAGNNSNNNDSTPYYPASYNLDNIVAVAATTRTDTLASYSNYGATTVDLGVPGSDLYTTYHSSDSAYVRNSGTSFSAPVTAGALALLRARYPHDSYLELIDRVFASVDPLPALEGKCVTGGRLNLAGALGPAFQAEFTASPFAGEVPLTVQFTDQSFGEIVSWSWEFGDGATSSLEHPSHTFNQPGSFTVQLTVMDATGRISQTTADIHAVANYQIQTATFDWIDPSNMPTLTLTVNGVSAAQSLPFTFNYYGQNYTSLYVSANGMAGFLPEGLNAHNNVDLPNPALPNGMLCPWWDDLNPEGGGTIHVGTTGAAPDRRFVVSWVGVPHRSPGRKASFTFQAVLEEASQRIVFQYLNVDASHSLGAGKSATVGVEDPGGTVAARYSYNGSTLLQNQQAIAFVPASFASLHVTPADTFIAAGPVGGPFAPASQNYTVSNTGTAHLDWESAAAANWLSITPVGGTLAPGESTSVSLSLHSNANDLPAGAYTDTVTFVNLDDGAGNTTRSVSLTVEPSPGVLTLSLTEALSSTGFTGGPFTPTEKNYTVSNTGGAALDWAATGDRDWFSPSSTGGTLLPGEEISVIVALASSTSELPAGTHEGSVTFANVTTSDQIRVVAVSLDVFHRASLTVECIGSEPSTWRLTVTGEPGHTYTIERTTDYQNWVPVHADTLDAQGTFEHLLSDPTLGGFNLFRAVWMP